MPGWSGRTSATATPTSRTFDRLGLPYVIVSAMSGAMGGSASEEFLAPLEVGEDTFVRTASGNYAANVEAVRVPVPPTTCPTTTLPPAVVHDTPGTPTIATLVDHLNGRDDLRRAGPPVDGGGHAEERRRQAAPPRRDRRAAGHRRARRPRRRPQAAGGRRSPRPCPSRSPTRTSPATRRWPRDTSGRARSGTDNVTGIRYVVDPRVVTGTRWVTGADEPGRHVVGLVSWPRLPGRRRDRRRRRAGRRPQPGRR